jgi:hypothetical protein
MPLEYLELFLCRDVYHCTPVELSKVPLPKILTHLTVLDIEAKMQKEKAKQKR